MCARGVLLIGEIPPQLQTHPSRVHAWLSQLSDLRSAVRTGAVMAGDFLSGHIEPPATTLRQEWWLLSGRLPSPSRNIVMGSQCSPRIAENDRAAATSGSAMSGPGTGRGVAAGGPIGRAGGPVRPADRAGGSQRGAGRTARSGPHRPRPGVRATRGRGGPRHGAAHGHAGRGRRAPRRRRPAAPRPDRWFRRRLALARRRCRRAAGRGRRARRPLGRRVPSWCSSTTPTCSTRRRPR